MKSLLGCLMCLVLTLSQAFAISGGPFSGRDHVTVIGTYAGALIPVVDPGTGLPDPNSLAVFTLTVRQTGLATGTAAIFRNGFYYPGSIQAAADPSSAQISGGIQGQFNETVLCSGSSGTTSGTNQYFASGTFHEWKVFVNSGAISLNAVRLRGSASISYVPGSSNVCASNPGGDSGGPIPYKVKGFKQSFSVSG